MWQEVQDFHWIKQEKSPNFELYGIEVEKEEVLVDQSMKYDTLKDHKEEGETVEPVLPEKITYTDVGLQESEQVVYDYSKPLTNEEVLKKREEDLKRLEQPSEPIEQSETDQLRADLDDDESSEDEI